MNRLSARISGFVFVALALFALGQTLIQSWELYLAVCPSKDVLTSDGNNRMIQALDRYQDIQAGDYGELIASYFRANTWPPLRPTISLILFGIAGPSQILDTGISFLFFCLLFPSLYYVTVQLSGSELRGGALFLLITVILLQTFEFLGYALSSMLETQGMFFLLWSIYFIYKMHGELYPAYRAEDLTSAAKKDLRREGERNLSRGTKWGLAFSLIGLNLTKYPYGVMLFLALSVYEFFRHSGGYIEATRILLTRHYRGGRRIILFLAFLFLMALVISGKFGLYDLNSRATKNLIYFVSVVIFVDFNVYLFRNRYEVREMFPASMRHMYLYGIGPSLAWIFSNPDRFNSILGGQLWVPPAAIANYAGLMFRKSFFETLLGRFFEPWFIIPIILLLAFLGVAFFLRQVYFYKYPYDQKVGLAQVLEVATGTIKNPRVAVIFILVVQFIALEFATGNKQDRHIYHMIPALLAVAGAWVLRLPGFFQESKFTIFANWTSSFSAAGLGIFLMFQTSGIYGGDFFNHNYRPICFSDRDAALFEKSRWVAAQIEPTKRYIVINHGIPPLKITQREQTTEVNLLLRMRALGKNNGSGRVRNDHRRNIKSWNDYDRLLSVSIACRGNTLLKPGEIELLKQREQNKLQKRARQLGVSPGDPKNIIHPSGELCLKEYNLAASRARNPEP